MQVDEYFSLYHEYMDKLISDYFESGYFEEMILRTEELIGPYVEKDPTAFCSFEDHLKAVGTIRDFCILRAESIRGQLKGRIGSTIVEQSVSREGFIDASGIWLPDMGEIADLSYRRSE